MDDECNHARIEIRKMTFADGSQHYVLQCVNCWDRVGSCAVPHHQISDAACILAFNEKRREYFVKHRRELRERTHQTRQERREFYLRYLDSDEWRVLRVKVLDRAAWICEGCLERPATEVHHLTYERLGAEMCFDLRAVCGDCHRGIHGVEQEDEAAE